MYSTGHFCSVTVHVCYLLGIMSDDLPLQLLSGTKLEGQLKEGQSEIKDRIS